MSLSLQRQEKEKKGKQEPDSQKFLYFVLGSLKEIDGKQLRITRNVLIQKKKSVRKLQVVSLKLELDGKSRG